MFRYEEFIVILCIISLLVIKGMYISREILINFIKWLGKEGLCKADEILKDW